MKVKDQNAWLQQVQEFKQDELGTRFCEILEFWADAAEKEFDESGWTPTADVLRELLPTVEKEFGVITTHWLSQLLTVLVIHWENGMSLEAGLTIFERKMVQEAFMRKAEELQQQAAIQGSEES